MGLNGDTLGCSALDALAKTTRGFKRLHLEQGGLLGKKVINNLSSIVSRSQLSYISISTYEDSGRVRILESIQWKHLRDLIIYLKPGTFETSVIRALVDGVTKMSEKVGSDTFRLLYGAWCIPLTLTQDLLEDFLSSTSIKVLKLFVDITVEQILSLFGSTDFSRLEELELWTEGFDAAKVDVILDALQHATSLKRLVLHDAKITDVQKRQMNAKGTSLRGRWWN